MFPIYTKTFIRVRRSFKDCVFTVNIEKQRRKNLFLPDALFYKEHIGTVGVYFNGGEKEREIPNKRT